MKIYFLRHGQADWPNWAKPDDERPLTKKGKKEMEEVGKFLANLAPEISLIITSPLPRARQTAEIAAAHLDLKLQEEAAVAKGFNARKLRALLEKSRVQNVMFVGHEPDFSAVIRELTGGRIKMAKAGIALVEMESSASQGELRWLIPPKIAKR